MSTLSPPRRPGAIAHERHGAGPPLVLVHALGGRREVWQPVRAALASERDVIAVDLPGFGDSAPLDPRLEPSPAALAHALAGLLDDLGIARAHVAGNSLGAWSASSSRAPAAR